jgi:hypothetical protein
VSLEYPGNQIVESMGGLEPSQLYTSQPTATWSSSGTDFEQVDSYLLESSILAFPVFAGTFAYSRTTCGAGVFR